MSVEPLMMGSLLAISVAAPPLIALAARVPAWVRFIASVALAVVGAPLIFALFNPDYHYGPLYGLAMVMNLCISMAVVAVVMAIFKRKAHA